MSAWSETRQVEPKAIDLDLEGDTLREECGVFGIYRTSRRRRHHGARPPRPAASRAGSRGYRLIRRPCLSSRTPPGSRRRRLSDRSVIERLEGLSAIGHVRYSTTGGTILRNVQPLFAELDGGGFAVAHNGNLTNGLTLRRNLIRDGAICQSTTDTEVIVHLVARSREERVVDRFIEAVQADRGRLLPRRAHQQEADRRPRSPRHPPAGARRTRRTLHPGVGNLCARHHRRAVRARHRERRGRRDLRRRHRILSASRRSSPRVPASSNTSISPGPIPS